MYRYQCLYVYTTTLRIGNILVSRLHATVKHCINTLIMDIIHTASQKKKKK
jgi:hypothetical protein